MYGRMGWNASRSFVGHYRGFRGSGCGSVVDGRIRAGVRIAFVVGLLGDSIAVWTREELYQEISSSFRILHNMAKRTNGTTGFKRRKKSPNVRPWSPTAPFPVLLDRFFQRKAVKVLGRLEPEYCRYGRSDIDCVNNPIDTLGCRPGSPENDRDYPVIGI
jgi:hypothetical protein